MNIPDDQCYCLIGDEYCPNKRDEPFPFCREHRGVFAPLDNRMLIEQTARAMIQTMYVTQEKKLSAKPDRLLLNEFTNRLQELYGRRYSEEDAGDAISAIALEKGMYDDLFKQMGRDPKWKRFEKIIAAIHMLQAEGAEVTFNDSIIGKKTGVPRQVDVSIRFKKGLYDYLTIVECKDYATKVPIDKVEAFSKKIEDLGAWHGVMVSPHGFQKSGLSTAGFDNIELFTLGEIKSGWTKKIKADVISVPFPAEIELDYPYFEPPPSARLPVETSFENMLFDKDQHRPPISFATLLRNIAKWVVIKQLKLPCKVKAPLIPPALYQFPGTSFYTPIYAIYVEMEPYRVALGYEIDVPPKLIKYVYSDIAKERIHEFRAEDLPKVE